MLNPFPDQPSGFNEWERKSARQNQGLAASSSYQETGGGERVAGRGNGDTQSNSSDGSSISMLEETQSPDGDGYKTPNSLEQSVSITGGQMSDQFALAVLRLQHGLDQTEGRLARLEEQMKQSIASIRSLENQTVPKQMAASRDSAVSSSSGRRRHSAGGGCAGKLLGYLGQMKSVHWFYLSYPILVYVLIRAIERRRKSSLSHSIR